MLGPHPFRVFANPRLGTPGIIVLPAAGFRRAKAEIIAWPGYGLTPLRELDDLARQAGIATLRLKDEADRFGLGSFKALGGGYAVATLLPNELARTGIATAATTAELAAGRYRAATERITVTCATDGNHGRAVAWGAQRCHARCVIFIHATVSQARADAIARYGAEIRRLPGTYDDAVRECARQAAAHHWHIVSDTAWPGYTEIARDVMQGYRLMADEAADQWRGPPPTHVFIQGGVGGAAAAVSVQCRARFTPSPALIVVEPDRAACLLASAELGERTAIAGDLDTIMAGLACGEPSLLAWQELDRAAAAFMAIPDAAAVATLRLLAARGIVSGESGVAGLAGCLLAAADPAARAILGLDVASRVLLFSTEGATDPAGYARLVDEACEDAASGDGTRDGATRRVTTVGDAIRGDSAGGALTHGKSTRNAIASDDATRGTTTHGDSACLDPAGRHTTRGAITSGDATRGNATRGNATLREAALGETALGETARGEAARGGPGRGGTAHKPVDSRHG